MFEQLHYFETSVRRWAVALPMQLIDLMSDWSGLQAAMIRHMPAEFSRDEWAYLTSFLGDDSLMRPYREAFGALSANAERPCNALARPRGTVAVWLPGNVSLLGPLTLVMLSLTGNRLRLKASSRGNDLTSAFLDFARSNLSPGPLADYLCKQVILEHFDRHDARNAEFSRDANCRVVFGSDGAAAAVLQLPHRPECSTYTFSDRRSEAWLDPNAVDDAVVATLIKVFAIYGQAGCTSPSRVVLLNAKHEDAVRLRDRILAAWPNVIRRQPPIHLASQNVMTRQWAATLGWEASLAEQNAAVIAVGSTSLARPDGLMFLPIVACSCEEAVASLSANIQTIGYSILQPGDASWLRLLGSTNVKRFVPLTKMHHFGPLWDGWEFWRGMFEFVDVEV
jgi:hypothetical protein